MRRSDRKRIRRGEKLGQYEVRVDRNTGTGAEVWTRARLYRVETRDYGAGPVVTAVTDCGPFSEWNIRGANPYSRRRLVLELAKVRLGG